MPHNGVSAAIFDLGRVLLDFDHLIAARKICLHTSKTAEEIFSLFFDSALTRSFEAGKLSGREFFLEVRRSLDLGISYEDFVPIWNQIFFYTAANRATCAVAGQVRRHYKTAVLSNINILHYEYIRSAFPVFGPFDAVITSYEVGAVKPDAAIYMRALEVLKASPHEVFYTDDRPELIEAARAMGFRAYVFKGVDQLVHDLKENGIRVP